MRPQVTLIGGGMIAHEQILPSLFQLQRLGRIGEITVCDRLAASLRTLAEAPAIRRAFPGQFFRAVPDPLTDPSAMEPDAYRRVLNAMPPRNIVVVAVPDQLHFEVILAALEAGQHVVSVKPLVLRATYSLKIEREARDRGLFVGVEYHKRFDDRSLMARARYRQGMFGQFRLGTSCLLEKWYYCHSNFQNLFTCENTDAFVYVGCHYVDLVHFITGLLPVSVSVYGFPDRFPNGSQGYLWTDARVLWDNGACLNVQNALGFPNAAPGTNTQGLVMYCSGGDDGALISHSDQYRGLKYSYTARPDSPGATQYAEPSPDYFQYLDLGGPGLVPVGYGYRSVEYLVGACLAIEAAVQGMPESEALPRRHELLEQYDTAGIAATPANSLYNELVIEAARLSITNHGREALIDYGPTPGVRLRQY